jgi:plastocyanin
MAALLLPSSVGAQTQPAATIRIEMSEFAFRPAALTLTPGRPVRLVLVNEGQIAHQFETAYLRALPVRIVGDTLHAEMPRARVHPVEPRGDGPAGVRAPPDGSFCVRLHA